MSLVLWVEILHNYKFSILQKLYYLLLFINIYVYARVTNKIYIYIVKLSILKNTSHLQEV